MPAYYRVDVLTASGVLLAEIDNYKELAYTNTVNAPGVAEIVLHGANTKIQYLTENAQVEIYRRNDDFGLDWTRDFVGFLRKEDRKTSRGDDTYIASVIGAKEILNRRVNAHYAETTNRTIYASQSVETVMKTLVHTNVGAAAITASGRLRNGVITGVSIASNQVRGSGISWRNAYVNVLDDLQKLANAYAMDFDLNKTGASAWQFEVYPSQRGTDRTTTVLFALENGNMTDPQYSFDALEERTVALIGGDGEGSARQIVTISGSGYSALDDREIFVDARNNKGVTAVLTAAGIAALQDAIPEEKFTFRVLQTPSCYFGVHYFLGDKVKSRYKNQTFTQKIQSVTVRYSRDSDLEDITVRMVTS